MTTSLRGTPPPADAARVVDVVSVTKRFGDKVVLDNVTFHVPKGELLCLCGPNGAGKTTLLKIILGLVEADTGTVHIEGLLPVQGRRWVGYVPQRKAFDRDFPASPIEIVIANVRGRWPLRITARERDLAMSVLEKTGAAHLAHARMRDLSGGETERVLLARALATNPKILILDEPVAGVDTHGKIAIVDTLAAIAERHVVATILVTHDAHAIARCAKRVLYLEQRVRAWGLWSELSADETLSAIHISSGDHRSMPHERG
ncbi:MAG: ATP-binding cassette domain-containing protein [Polyangiaceae bacterium]|nr:ATP-binding cassette domain-containing protein [Polyangiaceae bacterium]